MTEPMVLYRSVSIPEVVDLCRRGAIFGGGNQFSGCDCRTHVFFGDEIDDRLIRQGEYVDRQVEYALRSHELTIRVASCEARIPQHADVILAEMRHDGIRYDNDLEEDLRLGWEKQHFRRAAFRSPAHRKYALLFGQLARLQRDLEGAYTAYEEHFGRVVIETEQKIAKLPYSSAILVTRPIIGGVVYSMEFGFSGHGKPEYGFRPGHVTIDHIAEVVLIKACTMVGRCAPTELGRVLCAADAPSAAAALDKIKRDSREAAREELGFTSDGGGRLPAMPKRFEMPPLPPGFELVR